MAGLFNVVDDVADITAAIVLCTCFVLALALALALLRPVPSHTCWSDGTAWHPCRPR